MEKNINSIGKELSGNDKNNRPASQGGCGTEVKDASRNKKRKNFSELYGRTESVTSSNHTTSTTSTGNKKW